MRENQTEERNREFIGEREKERNKKLKKKNAIIGVVSKDGR